MVLIKRSPPLLILMNLVYGSGQALYTYMSISIRYQLQVHYATNLFISWPQLLVDEFFTIRTQGLHVEGEFDRRGGWV